MQLSEPLRSYQLTGQFEDDVVLPECLVPVLLLLPGFRISLNYFVDDLPVHTQNTQLGL